MSNIDKIISTIFSGLLGTLAGLLWMQGISQLGNNPLFIFILAIFFGVAAIVMIWPVIASFLSKEKS